MEKRIMEMNKLINKFIFESSKFVWYAAFPYGLNDFFLVGEKTSKLAYDFEYFSFTKSTKTLKSIRALLKHNYNEDVLILIRSIFENYLACRYFNENPDKYDEFIFNPINIALAYYNVLPNGIIVNRKKEEVGRQENPSSFKMSKDKNYYYDFYDFLSRFAHCNFGVMDCFIDEKGLYSLEKVNYQILTRFFTIFTFAKLFEHVVTVEGEDFLDRRTEKACYKLVLDSNAYLEEIIDELIQTYNHNEEEAFIFRDKRMRKMLKEMKRSLKEELGSVLKD